MLGVGAHAVRRSARRRISIRPCASLSYVTGAHAFKVGFADTVGPAERRAARDNDSSLSYRFNNGVPNQITERATPYDSGTTATGRARHLRAGQVDDQRLTLNGGVRFDYFSTYFPEQHLGPGDRWCRPAT